MNNSEFELKQYNHQIIQNREFMLTRHMYSDPYEGAEEGPRLGRRESQHHGLELMYIYNIISTNFPNLLALNDLNHYFLINEKKVNIQFDISIFKDFSLSGRIRSYDAEKFGNKIPIMAINILSKSTWRKDFSDNLEKCRLIKIPYYVVLFIQPIDSIDAEIYHYPSIRLYRLNSSGYYDYKVLSEILYDENNIVNEEAILDCSDLLPFRIGLQKIKERDIEGKSLYRIIFIKKESLEMYLTDSELKDKIIEKKDQLIEEKEQMIKNKDQLIEEKEQMIKNKDQLIEEKEQIIKKIEEENQQLKKELEKYRTSR